MKKILLLCLLLMPAWLGGCIKDKGNYKYSVAERPEVVLKNRYMALTNDDVRDNLVIDPEVTYSEMSRLRFLYTFPNPEDADAPFEYEGAADGSLDDPMTDMPNGNYSGQLVVTVADDSGINPADPGMKYFYDVPVTLGTTPFSSGKIILADVGGNTQIHVLNPDGILYEDAYAVANGGRTLEGKPLKIIYNITFMGGMNYGYMVLTDNGGMANGAVLNALNMKEVRSLADNFESAPPSMAGPVMLGTPYSNYMGLGFGEPGPAVMLMGGKMYSKIMDPRNPGNPLTNMFTGEPMPGNYSLSAFTNDVAGGTGSAAHCFWGWDNSADRLVHFELGGMSPLFGLHNISVIDGSDTQWNPANVGLSQFITLQAYMGGGWLVASDGSKTYLLGWAQAGMAQMVGLRKIEFPFAGLISPGTLWTIDRSSGILFFSSGNKVYRYNPNSPTTAPEPLVAALEGEVTMLEFRGVESTTPAGMQVFDFNRLEVGTEGHLYQLDLNGPAGGRGAIIGTPLTLTGKPVDVYNHVTQ